MLNSCDFWQSHSAVQNHIHHPKCYHKIVRQPPLNFCFCNACFGAKLIFQQPLILWCKIPVDTAFQGDELSRNGGREMYSPRLQRTLWLIAAIAMESRRKKMTSVTNEGYKMVVSQSFKKSQTRTAQHNIRRHSTVALAGLNMHEQQFTIPTKTKMHYAQLNRISRNLG